MVWSRSWISAPGVPPDAGAHRSGRKLNAAKRQHQRLGYQWDDRLELAGREFLMSTRRGLGPARQSEPVDFEKLVNMDIGNDPLCEGGPVGPHNAMVLSNYFQARGVEGSMAKVSDVALNSETRTVAWRLSVSKTDPAALGCESR